MIATQNMRSCMPLSLVVMAAGAGSRFGGDKPIAAVGPAGQSLFEYSVYDAYKAGFKHVVFVVNDQQNISDFLTRLHVYGDDLKVEFVVQSLTAFVNLERVERSTVANDKAEASQIPITARTKPWGTAHAVLVCQEYIRNPFVVINADDYYGRENFRIIGDYLLANITNDKACVLPGYRLGNTVSSSGGVNRGICKVNSYGLLESIREVRNIFIDTSKSLLTSQTDDLKSVNQDSIVSMTFWGFGPAIFDILEDEFQVFLNKTPDLNLDEYYLPDTVNTAIKDLKLQVKVFDTSEQWKGLTYAADLPDVRTFIASLTEAGMYNDISEF